MVAGLKQKRGEHGADIASAASNKNCFEVGIFHERIFKDGKNNEARINSFRMGLARELSRF